MKGDGNCNYIDGTTISRGYKLITVGDKRVFEHRHLMEKCVDRKLNDNESVHHKNGSRADNRIENLELMTNSKHISHHLEERWKDNEYREKQSRDAKERNRDNFGRFV